MKLIHTPLANRSCEWVRESRVAVTFIAITDTLLSVDIKCPFKLLSTRLINLNVTQSSQTAHVHVHTTLLSHIHSDRNLIESLSYIQIRPTVEHS